MVSRSKIAALVSMAFLAGCQTAALESVANPDNLKVTIGNEKPPKKGDGLDIEDDVRQILVAGGLAVPGVTEPDRSSRPATAEAPTMIAINVGDRARGTTKAIVSETAVAFADPRAAGRILGVSTPIAEIPVASGQKVRVADQEYRVAFDAAAAELSLDPVRQPRPKAEASPAPRATPPSPTRMAAVRAPAPNPAISSSVVRAEAYVQEERPVSPLPAPAAAPVKRW